VVRQLGTLSARRVIISRRRPARVLIEATVASRPLRWPFTCPCVVFFDALHYTVVCLSQNTTIRLRRIIRSRLRACVAIGSSLKSQANHKCASSSFRCHCLVGTLTRSDCERTLAARFCSSAFMDGCAFHATSTVYASPRCNSLHLEEKIDESAGLLKISRIYVR
jgi:hypothetical protein